MQQERLTRRQREVLQTIREHVQRHGYPPTIRELGRLVGLRSTSTVFGHLRALARKGYT